MKEALRKQVINELLKCPLFDGCDSSIIYGVLEDNAFVKAYSSGETIMDCGRIEDSSSPVLAYVYSGRCLITSNAKSNSVLRISEEKDIIGLAGIFSKGDIETKVVAYEKKVIVLSLDLSVLNLLMEQDATNSIRDNLFMMLANKISFLNKKIATLTGGSAEKKLAIFLLSFGKDKFDIGISMRELSRLLDIGRSSLYRSIDSFETKNIIKRDGDTITILDKNSLENL